MAPFIGILKRKEKPPVALRRWLLDYVEKSATRQHHIRRGNQNAGNHARASKGLGGMIAAILVACGIEVDKRQQGESEITHLNWDLR